MGNARSIWKSVAAMCVATTCHLRPTEIMDEGQSHRQGDFKFELVVLRSQCSLIAIQSTPLS